MEQTGFGAFGKMPSVGDFFRLGAPRGFVQVWDEWLQRGLLQGAELLGDRWDACYMSAPIWRFCLSPGLAGPEPVLGVLMPSVDRVGRRFPLTLMVQLETDQPVLLTHFRAEKLFHAVEDLALGALEDDMTRDLLGEGLAALPLPDRHVSADIQETGQTLVVTRQGGQPDLLADVSAGLLQSRYRSAAVFSTVVDGAPRMIICEGLPGGANLQGLFDLNAAIWTRATQT